MKCAEFGNDPRNLRRSREGAWIEIKGESNTVLEPMGRSREGAWIEMITGQFRSTYKEVAPARERGLKCTGKYDREGSARSLPRGSVD